MNTHILSPLRHIIKRETAFCCGFSFYVSVICSGFQRSVSPHCISLVIGGSGFIALMSAANAQSVPQSAFARQLTVRLTLAQSLLRQLSMR